MRFDQLFSSVSTWDGREWCECGLGGVAATPMIFVFGARLWLWCGDVPAMKNGAIGCAVVFMLAFENSDGVAFTSEAGRRVMVP